MPYEDFTTYTEVDPNNRLTITQNKVNAVGVGGGEDAYVYKDFGADYFGDLELNFEILLVDAVYPGRGGIGIANGVGGSLGEDWLTGDVGIYLLRHSDGYYMLDGPVVKGVGSADWRYIPSNTNWYCTLKKQAGSDTLYLYIYDDAPRTNLVQTLSVSGLDPNQTWRYLYAFNNNKQTGGVGSFTGYAQNFEIFYKLPLTPTDVRCEDQVNPVNITEPNPTLSAIFQHESLAGKGHYYQVQVIEEGGDWNSPLWDSGKTLIPIPVSVGESYSIPYGGTPLLLDNQKYFQRWKFWDALDFESPWTDGTDNWQMFMSGEFEAVAVSPGQDATADQYNKLRNDVRKPHHRATGGFPIEEFDVIAGRHLLTDDEYNYDRTFLAMIVRWLKSVPPTKWLLCDGSTINKSTNPEYTELVDYLRSVPSPHVLLEDFEAYADGPLDGQGNWTSVGFSVGAAYGYLGKGIQATGDGQNASKIGTLRPEGKQRIWVNVNGNSVLTLQEDGASGRLYVNIRNDGIIKVEDGSAVQYQVGTNPGGWFPVDFEWRTDHMHRIRVNNGTWSAWYTPAGDWTNGLDKIVFWTGGPITMYIDEIGPVDYPYQGPIADEAILPNITDHIIKY